MIPVKSEATPRPRPYIAFATSKVVHFNNPKTGMSFCQFENNWARAMNRAGYMEPYKFSRRDRYPEGSKPDCKNCISLRAALAGVTKVEGNLKAAKP